MQTQKLCAQNADAVRCAMDWHVAAKHLALAARGVEVHLLEMLKC